MGFLFTFCSFLLVTCLVINCEENPTGKIKFEASKTCNKTVQDKTGHIQYSSSGNVPFNETQTCVFTINATEFKNSTGIFLYAKNFYLLNNDFVTISAYNDTSILHRIEGTQDPFMIFVSNHNIIDVTLYINENKEKTAEMGAFQMYYNAEGCSYENTISGPGVFQFPLYANQSKTPFECKLNLIPTNKDLNALHVSFDTFDFPTGQLKVHGSAEKSDIEYSNASPPVEILAKDTLTFSFNVTNLSVFDNVTLRYDLTTEACSDFITLNKVTSSHTLKSPSTNDKLYFESQKFDCLWLVESENNTVINFDLATVILTSASDQIVILDGNSQTSPLIARISQSNLESWKSKFIQTSGNHAWVAIDSSAARNHFKVEINVQQRNTGGWHSEPGQLLLENVQGDGVFLFKLQEGKQVKFSFNKEGNKIPDKGQIKFYKDFVKTDDPIVIYDKTNMKNLLPVVSMEHTMTMELANFAGGSINANYSIQDIGCYALGSGIEGAYTLRGNCNNKCSWKIPSRANSTDDLLFHFASVNLQMGDILKISQLDSKLTSILEVTGPIGTIPDLIVPASDGVVLEVDRKNCSSNDIVLQASFSIKTACDFTYNAASGAAVTLSSPSSPSNFPLNSKCFYKVIRASNESLLHLSFELFNMANANHTLNLYTMDVNKTIKPLVFFNSSAAELPIDYLVKSDIYLIFNSTIVTKMPLKTASGFSLSVTTIDFGDNVTGMKSGDVESPGYPAKVKSGSVFSWVVDVGAGNIISFQAGNLTKEEELEKYVTIYDGPTIRAEQLKNFTGDNLLSRTSSLIFLYRHQNLTIEGPPMLFHFETQPCNMSLMCNNKICMHEDWKCDGLNQCGDWSDEKDCQGTIPGPPPPTPTPAPSRTTGTSTTGLTLGILAALLIGVLLGVAAPAAYRRIAGNRFSTYSTFSNTPE